MSSSRALSYAVSSSSAARFARGLRSRKRRTVCTSGRAWIPATAATASAATPSSAATPNWKLIKPLVASSSMAMPSTSRSANTIGAVRAIGACSEPAISRSQ